jgi:plasmid stabilization system protein ParE
MSRKVGFKPLALREFHEAMSWYEQREAGLGVRFEAAVNSAFGSISANPERFPRVAQIVRKAHVVKFPYSIYFTVTTEKIMVLAVHHGRRDPRRLKRRLT